MPREEYQVPSASQGNQISAGGSTNVDNFRSKMSYLCGDCGASVSLGKDATVQCPYCAGRVLYKERTKR